MRTTIVPGRLSRALVEGGLAGLAGGVTMAAVSQVVPRHAQPRVPLGRLVPVDDRGGHPDPGEQVDRVLDEALRVLVGVACGVGYGFAVEYLPLVRPGSGAVLCALLWFSVDETLAPLLGLSHRPRQQSSAERAYAIAPDVAYGVVTDLCLGLLRRRR